MAFVICDPSNIASSPKRNLMTTVGKRQSLSRDVSFIYPHASCIFVLGFYLSARHSLPLSFCLTLTLSPVCNGSYIRILRVFFFLDKKLQLISMRHGHNLESRMHPCWLLLCFKNDLNWNSLSTAITLISTKPAYLFDIVWTVHYLAMCV